MSLTGALEAFPIAEVIGLIGKTRKSGVLKIDGDNVEARVYFTEGQISYGTTRRDEEFHAKLVEAGLVDPKQWVHVERRDRSISDILASGASEETLTAFLKDQVSDVLFRILRQAAGTFSFSDDVAPRFDTGVLVDVGECIDEANHRIERWSDIEQVIPGVGFHLRPVPSAAGDDGPLELDADEWRVLAGLLGQASVEHVARTLGWSEFKAAETMAAMVRRGLLEVADHRPSARHVYGEVEPEPASIEVVGPRVPASSDSDGEAVAGGGAAVDPMVDKEPDEDERELLKGALSDMVSEPEDRLAGLRRRRGIGSIGRDGS